MEANKTMVCTCEKCGNEAEMTIKCEEVVVPGKAAGPSGKAQRRTVVCSRCGNEADLLIEDV